jgi:hypothetical protein
MPNGNKNRVLKSVMLHEYGNEPGGYCIRMHYGGRWYTVEKLGRIDTMHGEILCCTIHKQHAIDYRIRLGNPNGSFA